MLMYYVDEVDRKCPERQETAISKTISFNLRPLCTTKYSMPQMAFPATLARMAAQVHITAIPGPKNLAESKLILGALQRFGEVLTYRNLKVTASVTALQEVTNTDV